MSYSHSFSPEIYYAAGEPYDRNTLALDAKGRPVSLYSAIRLMSQAEWKTACRANKLNWKIARPEDLVEAAQRIDSVTDLGSPVEFHLSEDGWCTVRVWDGPQAETDAAGYPANIPVRLFGYPVQLEGRNGYWLETWQGRLEDVEVAHLPCKLVSRAKARYQGTRRIPEMSYWQVEFRGRWYAGRNAGLGMSLALKQLADVRG